MENILAGLGGGGLLSSLLGGGGQQGGPGGLMSLFGPPGGFLGMLNGGGGQPAPSQRPSGMSGMDLFNGPLAGAAQDPMKMLGQSLEPFGLLKMIMQGLQ